MLDLKNSTMAVFKNSDKISLMINQYVVNYGESLSYEYVEGDNRLVFITGKNSAEINLPLFTQPIIIDNVSGGKLIAVDLRQFMKSRLDGMLAISDKMKDSYNATIEVNRAVFTKIELDGKDDYMNFLDLSLMINFSTILTNLLTMLLYNTNINSYVDIICKLHWLTMDLDTEPKLNELVQQLPRDDAKALLKGDLKDLYKNIVFLEANDEFTLNSKTIHDLLGNINSILPETVSSGLDVDTLISLVSRAFIAINSKELAVDFIENKNTFKAILIAVVNNSMNNNGSMKKILDKTKRITSFDKVVKELEIIIEKEKVE